MYAKGRMTTYQKLRATRYYLWEMVARRMKARAALGMVASVWRES